MWKTGFKILLGLTLLTGLSACPDAEELELPENGGIGEREDD